MVELRSTRKVRLPPSPSRIGTKSAHITQAPALSPGRRALHDAEWSFGYCERGTGVYSCNPRDNPMYSFRETVTLGATTLSESEVSAAVQAVMSNQETLPFARGTLGSGSKVAVSQFNPILCHCTANS